MLRRPRASAILFVWSRDPSWANPGVPGCSDVTTTTLTSPVNSPVNKTNECGECPPILLESTSVWVSGQQGQVGYDQVRMLSSAVLWAGCKTLRRSSQRRRCRAWSLLRRIADYLQFVGTILGRLAGLFHLRPPVSRRCQPESKLHMLCPVRISSQGCLCTASGSIYATSALLTDDAQTVSQLSQVFHLESGRQLFFRLLQILHEIYHQDEIVHIDAHDVEVAVLPSIVHTGISLALLESRIEKMTVQFPIPTPRGLLQPVQGPVKVAHLLFFTFHYETLRLAHVDVLI